MGCPMKIVEFVVVAILIVVVFVVIPIGCYELAVAMGGDIKLASFFSIVAFVALAVAMDESRRR